MSTRVFPLVLSLSLTACMGSYRSPESADGSTSQRVPAEEGLSLEVVETSSMASDADRRPDPAPVRRAEASDAVSARSAAAPVAKRGLVDDMQDLAAAEPEPSLSQDAMGGNVVGRASASTRERRVAPGYGAVGTAISSGAPAPTSRPRLPSEEDYVADPGAGAFTDYGVRDFIVTATQPMGTFAADVDTASYTVTRRRLREGYLPPTSAVRVEEFVNYFPYEYAQPKGGDPFAVDAEATPSPFNPKNVLLRLGVQAKEVTFDERKPVHLTFLVDVSGSMRGTDRIELVKRTVTMLADELEDGDTLAIATYSGSTRVVLDPTPVSQKAAIQRAVSGLMAGGSTAMGAGIDLAYSLAERSYQPGAVNRVIIASDGDANVGQTGHAALSAQLRKHADRGITLTTLGFGNGNYKDTMMERLANDGDGNYYYIDSIQESRRLFVDKLSSTLEVVAKDVKLQVEFDPSVVRAWRLVGYENRHIANRDFRNDKVDAGEIGSGHQVTALYELVLQDDPRGALGTVRIRNKAPGADSPAVERSTRIPASVLRKDFAQASRQTRLQVAVATFAEILRDSPHVGEVNLAWVSEIARGAARPEYPEDAELLDLIDRAARLRGEGSVSLR